MSQNENIDVEILKLAKRPDVKMFIEKMCNYYLYQRFESCDPNLALYLSGFYDCLRYCKSLSKLDDSDIGQELVLDDFLDEVRKRDE